MRRSRAAAAVAAASAAGGTPHLSLRIILLSLQASSALYTAPIVPLFFSSTFVIPNLVLRAGRW